MLCHSMQKKDCRYRDAALTQEVGNILAYKVVGQSQDELDVVQCGLGHHVVQAIPALEEMEVFGRHVVGRWASFLQPKVVRVMPAQPSSSSSLCALGSAATGCCEVAGSLCSGVNSGCDPYRPSNSKRQPATELFLAMQTHASVLTLSVPSSGCSEGPVKFV